MITNVNNPIRDKVPLSLASSLMAPTTNNKTFNSFNGICLDKFPKLNGFTSNSFTHTCNIVGLFLKSFFYIYSISRIVKHNLIIISLKKYSKYLNDRSSISFYNTF